MQTNFLFIALAALIPMIMGFLWYGPLLFQNAWMKQLGFTEESLKGGNMAVIFILSYVFSFMLAFFLQFITVHQTGIYSSLLESGSTELTGDALAQFKELMSTYGDNYRSFKHGALHGVLAGVFVVLPVLATQAMFERKTAKYVLINAGYWILTIALMGGVVCQWGIEFNV